MRFSEIPITVRAKTPSRRVGEPVTCGVPLPKGLLHDAATLRIVDGDGREQPLQTRILDRWADGSARWVLCDWNASADVEGTYRIRTAEPEASARAKAPALADASGSVGMGPLGEVKVRRRLETIGSRMIESEIIRVVSDGREHSALPDFDWFIEDDGPLHVSVCERGTITDEGRHLARYTLRTHHFANSPVVRVHFTINNPVRAEHAGGLWDLGDSGSILIQGVILPFRLDGEAPFVGRASVVPGEPFQPYTSLILHQASSGGENWQSTNHLTRSRTVVLPFRGYYLSLDGDEQNEYSSGLRATPIVTVRSGDEELSVSVPAFWQNFPARIDAAREIWVRFLAGHTEPEEIQGGEQKEFVFYISRGRDTISDEPLVWTRDPLVVTVDPEWIASTGAIPYFTSQSRDPHRDYQSLANSAIEGDDTFEKKREIIDEYGWRHFGDICGDHEAVNWSGPEPMVSHYNNQYDAIAGFAIHWLRTGDVRWFRQMNELAAHVRDIDIYNTDFDKAAYNRGLFWHTYHYVDADTGTHRSYPKNGRIPPHNRPVPGGGPGSEQNYAHGLMLHYFLTGDEASKEAAIGLAQWVIDMDDGCKTVFGLLCRSETGLASASRSPDYHGPGRGAGNSLAALLDGPRLTGDPKFLRKAEQLIRRVIHPTDDVTKMVGVIRDGKTYVDAENRWFYVMFLQSLGKYLDLKAEIGELDDHYAYARASLLHYARWMAQNEYPYLDRPEILEYPTETWAAQDMWKSEVFDFAFLHADGSERERFRERAEFFFRKSVDTLSAMPTRTLCRPVVLMLSHGWRRAWFAANPDARRPQPAREIDDFGPRRPFTPQKVIAIRRAKRIAVLGAIAVFAGLVSLIVRLVT